MSAAKDEAEDGPLELKDDDHSTRKEAPQDNENEQTQEEELLTPKSSKPNGFEEEDDSLASNNELDREDFGPLQTSSPVLERPSSADESLSIPDDTPSLQVRPHVFKADHLLTAIGLYRIVHSRQRVPYIQLWPKSNTISTAL